MTGRGRARTAPSDRYADSATRSIDLVRHMQYFVSIAEHRHFGRAAESLGMSQPPLSQGIRRLEAKLGLRLFQRTGGVRLTAEGEALLPRARALITAAEAITASSLWLPDEIRLGVVPQVPSRITAQLARAVDSGGSAAPVIVTANSLELVNQVGAGQLDAALVIHPVVLEAVDVEPSLVRLPTWAVLPEGHPCAHERAVELADLAGTPLATAARAENPAAHDLLRDVAAAAGISVLAGLAPDDRGALLAAASGRYMALTADPELSAPGCALVQLAGDPLPLRLRFVWTRDPRRAPDAESRAALIAAVAG